MTGSVQAASRRLGARMQIRGPGAPRCEPSRPEPDDSIGGLARQAR